MLDITLKKTPDTPYVAPWEAGLGSTEKSVARDLSRILTRLGEIDHNRVQGQLADDLRDIRIYLHLALEEDGWRIRAKDPNGWKVLPPLRRG